MFAGSKPAPYYCELAPVVLNFKLLNLICIFADISSVAKRKEVCHGNVTIRQVRRKRRSIRFDL